MKKSRTLIPEVIERRILLIRGQKVLLDGHLAGLYGVSTKVLVQAVKRNIARFPSDFMFQLSREEVETLARSRSQSVTLKRGKNIKYRPYAFTEHGAIMAATVLNSPRAVQMSVFVVRAFVRMREAMIAHRDVAEKLRELERRVGKHDEHIQAIIDVIRQLMAPPNPPKRRIGFGVEEPKVKYRIAR
ncbi:MAG: ORF6N domain-containing protein [Ignavibacteriae bacterium]|nr:ORF6N domain-containing protein [Ignavibacteria bacterium]MBI3364925.1 ORF6N domain-containing protein [Ignavibacteriota bacterium]